MVDEKSFSDIQIKTWFDRFLPVWVYPYARLARWDRPVGVWLLFLPCLWGMFFVTSYEATPLSLLFKNSILFFMGALAMRGAGCTINDLWDRDLDRQVTRTQNRPLASGQLNKIQALGFLALQLLIGAAVLFQFNGATIIAGLLSLPFIIIYPLMKRWTWWPQVFLGITFNWGVLIGALAVTGTVSVSVVLFYIGALFWTMAYDTIYAFQDIEDDRMIGIKSSAQVLQKNPILYMNIFYFITALFFMMAGFMDDSVWFYYPFMMVVMGLHSVQVTFIWNPKDQHASLLIFKRHILLGWLITIIIFGKFLLTV